MNERKQWFIDRIGKRVHRSKVNCKCEKCMYVYENGVVIEDETHAIASYDAETELSAKGSNLRYFDSKDEVKEFEENKKNEDSAKYLLWKYMIDYHELILTDTELNDIIAEVEKYQKAVN